MHDMNKRRFVPVVAYLLASFCLFVPLVQASSEVNIGTDGKAIIKSVKVMQVVGRTYFTRLIWGNSYVRLTVRATDATKFLRKYGEVGALDEVREGDYLDLAGELESSSNALTLLASGITDQSIETQANEFSGAVRAVGTTADNFVLATKQVGDIVVYLSTTTTIQKGSRMIQPTGIHAEDTIMRVTGVFNHANKTMQANSILVYIDKKLFVPQAFEGRLKIAPTGSALPLDLTVSIGNQDFTVTIPATASVLTKKRATANISRFLVGDHVRIYGTRKEDDSPIINAEVIRNLDL